LSRPNRGFGGAFSDLFAQLANSLLDLGPVNAPHASAAIQVSLKICDSHFEI
jgi:hypothetical protein